MNTPILESWFAHPGAGETVVHQTEALIRHGEWFFVPAPQLVADAKRIRRHEPIRRSGGMPHMVEEIYRTGGEAIYHSEKKRRVLTVMHYRKLLLQKPQTVKEDWRIMQRGMAVYGRGTVRHPDHRTVTLNGWHRILMNTESNAPATNHVAILD